MAKTKEQMKKEIVEGKKEEDLYTDAGREVMREGGGLTDLEEGFMQGYKEGEKMAVCANCGIVLREDVVEEEFEEKNGMHRYRFCSSECATKFEEKIRKKRK